MARSSSTYGGGEISNEELQAEINMLKRALNEVALGNSIKDAIGDGFANLADMLEPLRTLRPVRGPLSKQEALVLQCIHATLARPDYSDVESGFDGVVRPATDKTGGKRS